MKKTLTMLLAILSIASTLAACSSSDNGKANDNSANNDNESVSTSESSGESSEEQSFSQYRASLNEDYEGYEFSIISRSEDGNPYWWTRDISVESENGDPINDAVYQRNQILNESLNVSIVNKPVQSPTNEANKLIMSGENDAFDIVTDGITNLASTLAMSGFLVDYSSLNGIELDNIWWDQRMNSDLSIANKLYFVTGDISIMDNEGTWQVVFNKDLQGQYQLTDYYALRDSGSWTMDILLADAIATSRDLDGDGTMNGEIDQFGLGSESWNIYALFAASGEIIVKKNDNDLPEYSLYNDRSNNVINKALDINANKDIYIDHNTHISAFDANRVMFNIVGMRTLPTMRQIEVEFGILPLPKYEESQDRYYSIGSNINLTAYSMPITLSDVERTAEILEALAGTSYYTLTPAYYDISLEGKYIRDDESSESISIILANRSYDLGVIFNWGNAINEVLRNMNDNNTRDFASKCAAIQPAIEAKITEFIENMNK